MPAPAGCDSTRAFDAWTPRRAMGQAPRLSERTACQAIISRSQVSMAKTRRTTSPFQQGISKPPKD
jgi:hypothetical protein